MAYDAGKHHRHSIRLKGYDYSQAGAYFLTICTQDRMCLFGNVVEGEMRMNEAGRMVRAVWEELPGRFYGVALDEFVVMPNHVHGIVDLVGAGLALPVPVAAANRAAAAANRAAAAANRGAANRGAASSAPTLGAVVRAFKSISAIRINRLLQRAGGPLWQRNYYEHILRNEGSLNRVRQYIGDNPAHWACDRENPAAAPAEPEDPWRA